MHSAYFGTRMADAYSHRACAREFEEPFRAPAEIASVAYCEVLWNSANSFDLRQGRLTRSPAGGSVNRHYQFDHERAIGRLRLSAAARLDRQTSARASRRFAHDGASARFANGRTSTIS